MMAERSLWDLWAMRGLYCLVCVFLLFVQLLPLSRGAASFAGPDLILVFTMLWALRRPEYVPFYSVAIIMLLLDFLLQRPVGLFACLVVIAVEFLRKETSRDYEMNAMQEWLIASVALSFVLLGHWLCISLLSSANLSLPLVFSQLIMSIFSYPILVAVLRFGFGQKRRLLADTRF